jgi:uncharacterized protein YfaT (DUF1175 family)
LRASFFARAGVPLRLTTTNLSLSPTLLPILTPMAFPIELSSPLSKIEKTSDAGFAAISEMQFYRISDEWNAEQRDCAGLVRFAWREALRKHDRPWFQRMGAEYESIAPDVKAFSLASNPLGEKLFRTEFGSFQEADLAAGRFSEFADARTLKNFNCTFITRDRRRAERGDLLFFHQPWVQKFPYHVMIFIGDALRDAEGASDWVVYHTGSSPNDQGTLKKVRLAVLDHHPDKRWRPIDNNENFLGYFRLKMLD